MLAEDTLQCPAVHSQTSGRFRHITAALLINTLNMFPPHAVGTHRVLRWRRHPVSGMAQGRGNAVGICRLRQIVERTGLNRGNCGRDVAEAGQHDDPAFWAFGTELGYEAETTAIFQLHVKNGVGRRRLANDIDAFGNRSSVHNLETAHFHGPAQARPERRIIIENE